MSESENAPAERSYVSQKTEILGLLDDYVKRGKLYTADERNTLADRREVAVGLSIFEEAVIGFYDNLEAIFVATGAKDVEILNMALYFRGAIGGGALILHHLDIPDGVRKRVLNEHTAPANQGKTDKKVERAERVRDIIEAAERHSADSGRLKYPKDVLELVRKRLSMPTLDRKTLMGYVTCIDQNRKIVIPPA